MGSFYILNCDNCGYLNSISTGCGMRMDAEIVVYQCKSCGFLETVSEKPSFVDFRSRGGREELPTDRKCSKCSSDMRILSDFDIERKGFPCPKCGKMIRASGMGCWD